MGKEWWNAPTTAWAFTAIGLGGGVVLTYLSPWFGIPIGSGILGFGIWLLIRAYRMRGEKQNSEHIMVASYPKENKPNLQKEQPQTPPPENKLMLITKAIMEAKQVTPIGKDVTVYITKENQLTKLFPQELKDILVKFQDDEKVITLKSFPDWMLPQKFTKEIFENKEKATLDPSRKHFAVTTLDSFVNWCRDKLQLIPDDEPTIDMNEIAPDLVRQHTCNICGKGFRYNLAFHNPNAGIKCPECGNVDAY